MALEYMLRIATNLEPEKVLDFFASILELKKEPDYLSGSGLIIYASPESELGRSIINDEFHFTPTVRVTFRLDKFDDMEIGKIKFLRGTLELLRQAPGDAVLLFNNEDVILQRTGGRLILNDKSSFWTPEHLSEVKLSYEMRSIASL